MGTPAAEVLVDEALVRRLLETQHADLAALPLRAAASGWDNATFRLGDTLAVRAPRRAAGAPLIENERWLAALGSWLPLPTPVTVRRGAPTPFYPWPWSIVTWIEGEPAGPSLLETSEALRLATFLKALHRPAPDGAPENGMRGVPLKERAPAVEERLARLAEETAAVTPAVRAAWSAALAAPKAKSQVWLHGDLHASNVLVREGKLAGIIDWGDICGGDPATDLAAFWMLFDADARDAGLKAYGADAATVARARGWAVSFGAVLLDSGRIDHPRHAAIGAETLRRV